MCPAPELPPAIDLPELTALEVFEIVLAELPPAVKLPEIAEPPAAPVEPSFAELAESVALKIDAEVKADAVLDDNVDTVLVDEADEDDGGLIAALAEDDDDDDES